MRTKYKYIEFVPTVLDGHWNCLNRRGKETLGSVSFYQQWKQYIFEPEELNCCVFSSDCLRDIAEFLDQLNRAAFCPSGKG